MIVKDYIAKRTEMVDALLKNPDWQKTCLDAGVIDEAHKPIPRRQARKYLQCRGKAWRYQAAKRAS